MTSNWQTFIASKNLPLAEEAVTALNTENILCDLSHLTLITVSGDDSASFLQNQLTNDIYDVTQTKHQYSAWCTPKGRAIATFNICKHKSNYCVSVDSSLAEYVIKRLRMYVLMSKVVLETPSETNLISIGFAGKNAANTLQEHIADIPTNNHDATQSNDFTIVKHPSSYERYEIIGEVEAIKGLWEKLSAVSTPSTHHAWQYLDIEAGIPNVTQASTEAWVPQMLNYHFINGVSFTKGCYPGQEIVARLKYLGKNKRQTYRILLDGNSQPDIGEKIISSASDTEAGKILNIAINPNQQLEALAVLKIAEINDALTVQSNAVLEILPLPYSVEEE